MSGETVYQKFTGYEYKEIEAENGRISFLIDGYENFGWEVDENAAYVKEGHGAGRPGPQSKKSVVHLKRDRKIINKAELTRLQRNFEACIQEIDMLEKAKTSAASVIAITIGILGTAFMAGSTFAVTAEPPHIILCMILAVPGFLGWILPYFVYHKVARTRTRKLTGMIEEKYDEIYEICEKGNKLLH